MVEIAGDCWCLDLAGDMLQVVWKYAVFAVVVDAVVCQAVVFAEAVAVNVVVVDAPGER